MNREQLTKDVWSRRVEPDLDRYRIMSREQLTKNICNSGDILKYIGRDLDNRYYTCVKKDGSGSVGKCGDGTYAVVDRTWPSLTGCVYSSYVKLQNEK